ncbi:MAG: acyl-CoA synthetase [Acidimicrobiia bacterium]
MAGGFWIYAAEDRDALGLVEPDGTEHTKGQLLDRVNQLSHGLRSLGLKRGDAVCTMLPNSVTPFEVVLAAQQSGYYITPINFHSAPPEIAYILKDTGAKAFVSHERFADIAAVAADQAELPSEARFAVGNIPGFRDYEELFKGQPTTPIEDRSAGLTMHYTSGTTGNPKGVKRSLPEGDADLSAELPAMFLMLFGIMPKDDNVHLAASPNYHTAVSTFGMNALHMGHAIVFMDKWDGEEALRLIEKYKVTHTHMVPTQFHRMLALPEEVRNKYDVSSMRYAIHAAAPCPIETKRKMLAWWGDVIYEYYGATEGGGTLATPQQWIDHPGTVGTAWPISTIKILDDDGNECPTGTPGTIYMKMDTGDFEYKDDPSKTSANRKDGFFTVGDVGYLDAEGYLFLCDRKIDMIISGGANIYPAEIEAAILQHPSVGDVAVFGIPDEDWGEQIKAVVEPHAGYTPSDALAAEILSSLDGQLAKMKWPKTIDFIETMPRDPNGKLYKRKLRDPYWEGRDRAI